MDVLIAVASKHGSTREIGAAIAAELRAVGLHTDLCAPGEVTDVSGYAAFVLGSAVYGGGWLAEMREFAARHYDELADRPVWLFSSGPLNVPYQRPDDEAARLAAPLGTIRVREHRVFAGKLDKDGLGWNERIASVAANAPEGDFRVWDEIHAWAREIAVALLGDAAAASQPPGQN